MMLVFIKHSYCVAVSFTFTKLFLHYVYQCSHHSTMSMTIAS